VKIKRQKPRSRPNADVFGFIIANPPEAEGIYFFPLLENTSDYHIVNDNRPCFLVVVMKTFSRSGAGLQ
jgi:hypothetical protein